MLVRVSRFQIRGESGMTMTEVVVASAIGAFFLFLLVNMEISQIGTTDQTRYAANAKYPDRQEASVAALRIARDIRQADRAVIFNGGNGIQLRRPQMSTAGCAGVTPPPAACFDLAANYQWDQYSRSGAGATGGVRYYSDTAGGCQVKDLVNGSITAMNFAFDATNPNVVTFGITWRNPDNVADTMVFPGEVAVGGRSMGVTDGDAGVTTGLQSPWIVMNPPAACP